MFTMTEGKKKYIAHDPRLIYRTSEIFIKLRDFKVYITSFS